MKNKIISALVLLISLFIAVSPAVLAVDQAKDLSVLPATQQSAQFDYFEVLPANCQAGDTSDYQLKFQLELSPNELPAKSGFVFTFPSGFDLTAASLTELFVIVRISGAWR